MLLWGFLIFAVFRFRGRARWRRSHSAEEVLAERYARGEITVEESRERSGVLKEHVSLLDPRWVPVIFETSSDPQEEKEKVMAVQRTLSGPRAATVAGLVVGALGIAILWASGVRFPFAIPPGLVILLAGALFVGLASRPWVPGVGAFLGLGVTVGFLISPTGLTNLIGRAGTSVAIGQGIQVIGVLTALIAGVIATRANYRKPADAQD